MKDYDERDDSLILRLSKEGYHVKWHGKLEPHAAKTLSEALEKFGIIMYSAESLDPEHRFYKPGECVMFYK